MSTPTRGILRQSSYRSSNHSIDLSTLSLDDDDVDSISVDGRHSLSSPTASGSAVASDSPIAALLKSRSTASAANGTRSHPGKPERRNVGKVQRQRRGGGGGGDGGGRGDHLPGSERPSRSNHHRPPVQVRRGISFSEKVNSREIPILPRSMSNDFFYDDDEIATFRHEKFMEDCGLDPVTGEPVDDWLNW